MKFLTFIFLIAFAQSVSAQIKTIALDKKSIPKSIVYKGHIINAVQYTDGDGEHLMFTTETGDLKVKDNDDLLKAELYACNYLITGNQQKLFWQMHDFTIACPLDTKAQYIPNTFAITDLNKDGKAEVWLMYLTACRGDVSPASMKIIMHKGSKNMRLEFQVE